MGVAEVIPGVSGGTIAFITGIYERLINCIKAFGPGLLPAFKEGGVKGVWKEIDGNFLLALLIGMGGGIVIGILGVSRLMETMPEVLWAFFFGLILASAIYIGRQVEKWGLPTVAMLIIGIVVAFGITLISPAEGNEALWFVFLSGVIAISALILPGISGSFILLLMGMYTVVIPSVKSALKLQSEGLLVTLVFGLGCITGLMTFSRVLSWTFKKFKNPTMALLTGFMIGSLNKIWPWRQATNWITDAEGDKKIISEVNVSPFDYMSLTGNDPMIVIAIAAFFVGLAVVFLLEKGGNTADA